MSGSRVSQQLFKNAWHFEVWREIIAGLSKGNVKN
jgi:hypothetical protein